MASPALPVTNPESELPRLQDSTPQSGSQQRPMPNQLKKNGPPNRKRSAPSERNNSFAKRTAPASLSIAPRLSLFLVYTSNLMLPSLVECVHQALSKRDRYFREAITLPQLKYVTCIAWFARLAKVAAHNGYAVVEGLEQLLQVTEGIKLPGILWKYIEILGKHEMSTGTIIAPYCSSYRELVPMASPWYYDPLEALEDGDRPDPQNAWSIDRAWITNYNQACATYLRLNVDLRTQRHELDGAPEMVIGYLPAGETLVTPVSPERSLQSVATFGAISGLRNYLHFADWPFGDNEVLPYAFHATPVDPINQYSEMLITAMQLK